MRSNKIVILLLIFIFLLNTAPIGCIAFAEDSTSLAYETEFEFLKSIKLIDSSFSKSAEISKAELTKLIARMMHPEMDFSKMGNYKEPLFRDVDASNPYYSYIKVCKDLKIIQGDLNQNFNPNQKLNMIETLTVVINALGYTQYAIAKGGYPSGFYSVAKSIGLTSELSVSDNEIVKGNVVAKMIYNALFADLVELQSVSGGEFTVEINSEKNILAERLNIYEYDAILYDDGYTAIKGDSITDPQRLVLSDFKTETLIYAYKNGKDVSEYLGCRVRIFIRNNKESGRNEVVYFTLHKFAKKETILADQIITINEHYLEYEPNKNSTDFKKISFGNYHPLIIFNGSTDITYELKNILSQDGFVTFIDNNNDNQYETVNILSFNYANGNFKSAARNVVTDTVKYSDKELIINCKFNPAMGLNIDFEQADFVFSSFSKIKKVEDIYEFDVISIAECPVKKNGKIIYYLTAIDQWLEGKIDYTYDNGLSFNNTEYELSTSITDIKTNYLKNININNPVTLQFDVTGKVVYILSDSANTKNYAYLISAGVLKKESEKVNVKLFTNDGKITVYELDSSVEIDGTTYDSAGPQLTALTKRDENANRFFNDTSITRPLIFKLNKDGQISKIDTDNPNTNIEEPVYNNHYKTQTLIQYANQDVEDEETLNAGYRSARFINLKKLGTSMMGKFYINNTSVMMAVPDIETSGINNISAVKISTGDLTQCSYDMIKQYEYPNSPEYYRILTTGDLSTNMFYDVQGYDIDPDTGVAGLVVFRGRLDSYGYGNVPYNANNPMYVFLKSTEFYDTTKEKTITKLYYTKDGVEELTALVDRDDLLFLYDYIIYGCIASKCAYDILNDIPALKAGDIIRVLKKGDYLAHIERTFKFADIYDKSLGRTLYPSMPTYPYSTSKAGLESKGYEKFTIPFDTRYYEAGLDATYNLSAALAGSANGSYVKCYVPVQTGKAFISNIKLNSPDTYTEEYLNLSGVAITLIQIDKNGEIKVSKGSISDIKTSSQLGSIQSASLLVYKHTSYNIEQMLIVNGYENLK